MKQNKIWLLVVFCLFILVIIGAAFVGYKLYESRRVAELLNFNIEQLNQNSNQNNFIIEKITTTAGQATNNSDFDTYQESIELSNQELETQIENTKEVKNRLVKSKYPKLEDFNEVANELLDYRTETLSDYRDLIQLAGCQAEFYNELFGWSEAIMQKWESLNDEASGEEIAQLATETSEKISISTPKIQEMQNCYKGKFENLIDDDILLLIDSETKSRNNLSETLAKLSSSIRSQNQPDFEASMLELQNINSKESSLKTTFEDLLNRAIEDLNTESNGKIAPKEKTLNQLTLEIKNKYRINN